MVLACDSETTDEPAAQWPDTALCEGLEAWPDDSLELESDALARIDTARADGFDCGEAGKLGAAPPLRQHPALECAARFHATDMVEREFFGRLDPDGVDERARVEAAGYTPGVVVQHVAAGPLDAVELVDRTWLPRAAPCADLVSESSTEVGLAFVGDVTEADGSAGTRWVVVLAGPDPER